MAEQPQILDYAQAHQMPKKPPLHPIAAVMIALVAGGFLSTGIGLIVAAFVPDLTHVSRIGNGILGSISLACGFFTVHIAARSRSREDDVQSEVTTDVS